MVEVAADEVGAGEAEGEEDGRVEAGVHVSIRRYPDDLAETRHFFTFRQDYFPSTLANVRIRLGY